MPCLNLGFDNDKRVIPRGLDVSLTFFITSVSGNKSFASFFYCFFHFTRPPGLRLTMDTAKRNERFGRIQYQEVKSTAAAAEGREEYSSTEGQCESM